MTRAREGKEGYPSDPPQKTVGLWLRRWHSRIEGPDAFASSRHILRLVHVIQQTLSPAQVSTEEGVEDRYQAKLSATVKKGVTLQPKERGPRTPQVGNAFRHSQRRTHVPPKRAVGTPGSVVPLVFARAGRFEVVGVVVLAATPNTVAGRKSMSRRSVVKGGHEEPLTCTSCEDNRA